MKKYLKRRKVFFKYRLSMRKKNQKYIIDESLKNFILEHSKVQNIDFSKIKIFSFLDILSNATYEGINLPRFQLNTFSELKNDSQIGNTSNFKSFIF